jgi:hypothetical protein
MRLAGIHPGDIVLVSKGGRHVHGVVEAIERGVVKFTPLTRGTTWRQASGREVLAHWRKSRVPGVEETPAVPKEQLSLPPWDAPER